MEYKGYELRFSPMQNRLNTHKARPYDDAEYYWAFTYDKTHWNIVYNGKLVEVDIIGTFESVVDFIETKNKTIKPIMCHN